MSNKKGALLTEEQRLEKALTKKTVSYTHLTLPTIA